MTMTVFNGDTYSHIPIVDSLSEPRRRLVEIFQSVKGEGTQAGTPMTFVRFAGCNLACPWCDTAYRQVNITATDKQIVDIICSSEDGKPAWVVFTGGEPLLQLSKELCEMLKRKKIRLAIESNGQLYSGVLSMLDYVCFSPKRMRDAHRQTACLLHPDIITDVNAKRLRIHELRYVVMERHDDPVIVDVKSDFITFSPLMHDPQEDARTVKSGDGFGCRFGKVDAGAYNRCLELVQEHRHRNARLSMQLHKLIGVR